MINSDLPITAKLSRLSDHFYMMGDMGACDKIDSVKKDVRNLELKLARLDTEKRQ